MIYFTSDCKLALVNFLVNLKIGPLPIQAIVREKCRVTFNISLRRKSCIMAGETSGYD